MVKPYYEVEDTKEGVMKLLSAARESWLKVIFFIKVRLIYR